MDDQCPITNEAGEVIKKLKLSELDKGTSSKKYVYISTAEGLTHRFTTTSDMLRDQDHFFVEKLGLNSDGSLAENTTLVTRCERISNTKINCINDHCLAEIFMYLPACERPKLALVCKQWKKALDNAWFDVKKLELIHWRYDKSPNCLAKYSTSDGGYSFLKSLLNKYGPYLTKLDLTAYGNCNIVPVVNELCPNLVTLRLRFTNMDEAILANSFTRLSKLKSLTIIIDNKEMDLPLLATFINSLRNVADTLTDLSFLNWIDKLELRPVFTEPIMDVVRDLKALESLELAGVLFSKVRADYLKDRNISYVNHTADLLHFLPTSKPFEDVKLLRMLGCRIKDNTLYSIANTFKNLVFLQIYSTRVTDDGVLALSKINNLKILNFHGQCNNITDSSVKLLKNLIKLNLPHSNKITDKSVITVLENSPKMDTLDVNGANVTAKLVKKAADISRKRKQRLIFCVALMPDIKQYDSRYFDLHIYKKINGIPTPVSVSARAHPGSDPQRVQEGQAKVLQIIK